MTSKVGRGIQHPTEMFQSACIEMLEPNPLEGYEDAWIEIKHRQEQKRATNGFCSGSTPKRSVGL